MNTNDKSDNKVIYPKLSYLLTGIFFSVHNDIGPFARERQYQNQIEDKLIKTKTPYKREFEISKSGNILDFLVADKIVIEVKAKRMLTKEDYYQTQRYLQESGIRLALLINFRNKHIKPVRIVRIDTDNRVKYNSKN